MEYSDEWSEGEDRREWRIKKKADNGECKTRIVGTLIGSMESSFPEDVLLKANKLFLDM